MMLPQIFSRLFFPWRKAADRPDPDKRRYRDADGPAESTREVLERAAASQDEGNAQAAEPARTGRQTAARAAEESTAARQGDGQKSSRAGSKPGGKPSARPDAKPGGRRKRR